MAVRLAHNAGNVGNLRRRSAHGCRSRMALCLHRLNRRCMPGAIHGQLVAAQHSRANANHQQQPSRQRRSL